MRISLKHNNKGNTAWNKGKKGVQFVSEETKKRMSDSGKKAWKKRKLKIA